MESKLIVSDKWKDFQIIDSGDGQKLEKWDKFILLRPEPQAVWAKSDDKLWSRADAVYTRSSKGGGQWNYYKSIPESWNITYGNMVLKVHPTGFKHTGLFPEQAVNWQDIDNLIRNAGREIKVLNLFAYSGAASVVAAKAGAMVTHIDASKGMVEMAKENAHLNNISSIRFLIDDCTKFIEREIRRGNSYDAIIMDPPSYGRGTNGQTWKLEDNLFDFVMLCKKVLSKKPLFVLISSYTTGLQPTVLKNILSLCFGESNIDADEIGLSCQDGLVLPCGARGLKVFK